MNTERKCVTTVVTPQCYQCGDIGEVALTTEESIGYYNWKEGIVDYIQDAMPTLPKELREQLKTGTHPKCWEEMFNFDEEDEYALSDEIHEDSASDEEIDSFATTLQNAYPNTPLIVVVSSPKHDRFFGAFANGQEAIEWLKKQPTSVPFSVIPLRSPNIVRTHSDFYDPAKDYAEEEYNHETPTESEK